MINGQSSYRLREGWPSTDLWSEYELSADTLRHGQADLLLPPPVPATDKCGGQLSLYEGGERRASHLHSKFISVDQNSKSLYWLQKITLLKSWNRLCLSVLLLKKCSCSILIAKSIDFFWQLIMSLILFYWEKYQGTRCIRLRSQRKPQQLAPRQCQTITG